MFFWSTSATSIGSPVSQIFKWAQTFPTEKHTFLAQQGKPKGVKSRFSLYQQLKNLKADLTSFVLEPFIGDGRPGDVAAELLQFFTLIGAPAHRRVQVQAMRIDLQLRGGRPDSARQALQAQRNFSQRWELTL